MNRPRAHRLGLVLASLSVLVAALPAAGATESAASADPAAAGSAADPATAALIGQQAYDYGIPLLEVLRVRHEMTSVRCPDAVGDAPVNEFSNARRFADASFRTVVAPNTDTLYSIAHLDLSHGPIVLRHPAMGHRYYSFAMLDPYTNVIATPGAREDGGRRATIEVRWSHRPGHGRLAARSRFSRVITSPYRRVWVIGRTLAGDAADQRRAYHLMTHYTLSHLDGSRPRVRAGCKPGKPTEHPVPTTGAAFVVALDRALKQNPPPRRDRPILARLAPYGIGPGLSTSSLDPATRTALYQGIATEASVLPQTAKVTALTGAEANGGWYFPAKDTGDYGTDYTARAQLAILGLGANTPQEAIYPAGLTDSTGLPLLGQNAYRITFAKGHLPPARYFWSLTMYDSSGYLVANSADRYSIGPSHPPLVRQADGSVVVDIAPIKPTATDVNWLPSPTSGMFRLNLRLYGPSKAALDGTWQPPGVQDLGPAVAAAASG